MDKKDYYFELPEALIARFPLANRSDSRLLVADPNHHQIQDYFFKDLPNFLQSGDVLVFNNSRVIPARIYAQKPTGGKVEILIERILGVNQALVHLGSNKPVKLGQSLLLPDASIAHVVEKRERLFVLDFSKDINILERLSAIGHMPLPPYLKREDTPADLERYQTVYAKHEGSVAAPTAGLHFDEKVLEILKTKGVEFAYVTLHVGAGTFMPVQVENIKEHRMHYEWMEISQQTADQINQAKQQGRRIVAVGTTSVRSLESAAADGRLQAFCGDTNIFILPGYHFQIVDALITNFHLPESTLMMLVAAFIGFEFTHMMYRHAIAENYRFYSYGDTSLLFRKQ